MLYLSFDFGIKNIGAAIGQNITNTANILQSIKSINKVPNWTIIENMLLEWKPSIIVVGYPLNIDGTKQKITKKVEEFANIIYTQFNIPVNLHDERLTTVEARNIIFKKYGYKKLTKNNIDSFSALIILESWLSSF
ncbi:putative Holliday junction resolvase [Buchnera aphidicola (Nipponaphis monzeni)]|uniref:Putative pre-16S rRNA nuclease n=1 Tax=Buchnera aphidicola (Nipponaphis monzeni) TaxID=2495405 RepID=A0A455TAT6_9GAMM|nr:Holliday junction resolvase RuvX [Buchnera aphidicola]BBI01420.1 putative Holliday junction resolvase [Buchnera aphidicola (Nipponaphis monzeni)]